MLISPAYYRRWAARFAQIAQRSGDDHTAEELLEIATRLRALAKRAANQRIKRNYQLEQTRLTAPARQRELSLGGLIEYGLCFLDESGSIFTSDLFRAPDDATAVRIAAAIGHATRDAHSGYILRQGSRQLHGSGNSRVVLASSTTARWLAPGAQEIVLSLEESLLDSRSRISSSRKLLHARATLLSQRQGETG